MSEHEHSHDDEDIGKCDRACQACAQACRQLSEAPAEDIGNVKSFHDHDFNSG